MTGLISCLVFFHVHFLSPIWLLEMVLLDCLREQKMIWLALRFSAVNLLCSHVDCPLVKFSFCGFSERFLDKTCFKFNAHIFSWKHYLWIRLGKVSNGNYAIHNQHHAADNSITTKETWNLLLLSDRSPTDLSPFFFWPLLSQIILNKRTTLIAKLGTDLCVCSLTYVRQVFQSDGVVGLHAQSQEPRRICYVRLLTKLVTGTLAQAATWSGPRVVDKCRSSAEDFFLFSEPGGRYMVQCKTFSFLALKPDLEETSPLPLEHSISDPCLDRLDGWFIIFTSERLPILILMIILSRRHGNRQHISNR